MGGMAGRISLLGLCPVVEVTSSVFSESLFSESLSLVAGQSGDLGTDGQ
jgi:hypothetical protein